jgi:glycosyltransferase involved in cell wall biosynthesis
MTQHEPLRRRARLLMAGQDQFGYLTDSYQFASHLRDTFEITYLGWDDGLPRVAMDGVRVVYLPRAGGKLRGLLMFLVAVFREIRRGKFDLVYISHFPGAGLYPLFMPRCVFVLDVRTGYVRQGGIIRWIMNREILIDSLMFRHVTVISESLREVLGINKSKVRVVPLGADMPELPPKRFDGMHLLYVGSLEVRHIDRTVAGFARFYKEFHTQIPLSYDIVGFGPPEVEQTLRAAIVGSGCAGSITFHGRVPLPQLGPFLARNTVGMAFIPIEDHYQCQPATKLFEYLLAGMAVLATRTYENARIVRAESGVLIDHTADAVYGGLKELHRCLHTFDSRTIRLTVAEYTWARIVREHLAPYLLSVLDDHQAGRRVRHRDARPATP